jgi:hypothetical protein
LPAKKAVKNMRVGPQPIIARPAWYDRNPTVKVDHYNVSSASPHSQTLRLTYTCPSGKKAMVELLSGRVTRVSAATTPDVVLAEWALTPSGGTEKSILQARLITNNVGDTREHSIGSTLILNAGDALKGYTQDSSVGGACHYYLSYKITEFDA